MDITSLYDKLVFHDDKPAIAVMIDNDHTKEIRIAFKSGHEMKEHKTKFPIVIQIVEGQIDFGVEGRRVQLPKGSLIALDGNVPHDLKAMEDSVVRLTLSKHHGISRIKNRKRTSKKVHRTVKNASLRGRMTKQSAFLTSSDCFVTSQ